MPKYDVMLENNRIRCAEREERTIETMRKMFEMHEQITIAAVSKKTNCCRNYFYHNERVATEMRRLMALQGKDFLVKRKVVLEKALGIQIANLENEIKVLQKKIESLTEENEKLKKAARRREVDYFNEL